MGQDLESILKYFKSSHTSLIDYIAVIFLLLIIVFVVWLAYKEYRIQKRTKKIVKKRYRVPIKTIPKTKRVTPRLPVQARVSVLLHETQKVVEGEIVDISTGGTRLILFDFKEKLTSGNLIVVSSPENSELKLDKTKAEIINFVTGPRSDTPVLHCRWIDLEPQTARELSRQIRKRLLGNL